MSSSSHYEKLYAKSLEDIERKYLAQCAKHDPQIAPRMRMSCGPKICAPKLQPRQPATPQQVRALLAAQTTQSITRLEAGVKAYQKINALTGAISADAEKLAVNNELATEDAERFEDSGESEGEELDTSKNSKNSKNSKA